MEIESEEEMVTKACTSNASLLLEHYHEGVPSTSTQSIQIQTKKGNAVDEDLPVFGGKYEDWFKFRDAFYTLVDANKSLSNIQKFIYLTSSLKKPASDAIKSLEITNANYPVALQLLEERYGNRKLIVNLHIRAIFKLKIISEKNHVSLEKLLDQFTKHYRALETLGQPVEHWDTLLIHILVNKLDGHTRKMWEMTQNPTTLPTLQELLDFLRGCCRLLQSNEDVKLHQSKDVWRPARFCTSAHMTEDEKKTAEIYRKVRGALNKLTPQKFGTLVNQVRALQIDTNERLQGVIDLVFEKAVDEPIYSVAYALMCRELALMQVPANTDGKKKKDEYVNFRKLLVTRCQMEFEKNSVEEGARNKRLNEIKACNDPKKKKDLQLQLEEDDRRIRMRSVRNIKFIGELFKQQMLTKNIIMRCLENLLDNEEEEESLECLCKLLTTAGKELEVYKNVDLSLIFDAMKEMVDKKHGNISGRVRCMLQDVIDLRNKKWVPRRQDSSRKTIDQIKKEAELEQLNIHAINSVPITPHKNDRNSNSLNVDRKCNLNNNDPTRNSKASYNSKGPSWKHTYKYKGHNWRSGSGRLRQSTVVTDVYAIEKKINSILDEYLYECCGIEECDKNIRESIPSTYLQKLVSNGYLNVLERSNTDRLKTRNLFIQLIKLGTLSVDNYCSGLEKLFAQANDLIIDVPKVWDYLAEFIAPLLIEEILSFNELHRSCEILIEQGHTPKLLAPLFKLVVKEKSPNFLCYLWSSSNASLSSFVPPDEIDNFVEENKCEYLLDGSNLSVFQFQLSYKEIYEKLLQLFSENVSFRDTVKWIDANVGERVKEDKFIRTLATAIFESSIEHLKLNEEALEKKYNYFSHYVDRNSAHELQCLYALQAVVNKLKHPSDLLCKICNSLYKCSAISKESFISWKESTDFEEREGKGVALLQLTSFFELLIKNGDK